MDGTTGSPTLNLVKGEKVDLTKTNPDLKTAHVGLGWDTNAGTGAAYDLDAFCLLLTAGKKIPGADSVVYFNHLSAHGVTHTGDNLTGAGDGDDETIKVNFASLDGPVDEVLICVNIYNADERKQNFGQVKNAFVRIYDADTNKEILKYDLNEDYSANTGIIMGKLYKKDGQWKFQAIGEGKNGTITDIAAAY